MSQCIKYFIIILLQFSIITTTELHIDFRTRSNFVIETIKAYRNSEEIHSDSIYGESYNKTFGTTSKGKTLEPGDRFVITYKYGHTQYFQGYIVVDGYKCIMERNDYWQGQNQHRIYRSGQDVNFFYISKDHDDLEFTIPPLSSLTSPDWTYINRYECRDQTIEVQYAQSYPLPLSLMIVTKYEIPSKEIVFNKIEGSFIGGFYSEESALRSLESSNSITYGNSGIIYYPDNTHKDAYYFVKKQAIGVAVFIDSTITSLKTWCMQIR